MSTLPASSPASSPFTGIFFCVTARSIYEVNLQVRDPVSACGDAPVLRKVATRADHGGRTVPWYVRGKFHLAITPDGIQRYSLHEHQRAHHPVVTANASLPDIETVDEGLRGLKTGPIVGLFAGRDAADACHEHSEHASVFDLTWLGDTTHVLTLVTDQHPLISISAQTTKLIAARTEQAAQKH